MPGIEEGSSDARIGTAQDLVAMLGAVSSASYLMLFWLPIPVDLALYALVVLAALTIWLAEPNVRSSWPWPDALMVAFLFSLAASIAVSADIQRSLALSSGVIPAVMLYLMTTRYIAGLDQLKILFFGLTAGALGVSAVVLFHAAFGGNAGELIDKAAIPVLVVPNDVLFLSLIAPLTLSLLAIGESRLVKAGALLSLVTTAASVAALQSRSGMIVLGFSTAIALFGIRMAVTLRAVLAGLVAILCFDAILGFPLLGKFASLCDNRGALWAAAWELFLEKPIVGHGPHTFIDLYQSRIPDVVRFACEVSDDRIAPWPHNLFLELLSSQGIFATLAFCATIIWAGYSAYLLIRSKGYPCAILAWGLLGSLTGFVLAGMVELSLLRLWVVVLFAVLVGSLVPLAACSQNSPPVREV